MNSGRRVTLLVLLLLSPGLQAHLLKVFAFADGNRIVGSAYFVGGAKASGATITVRTHSGQVLAGLHPDADGRFSYIATARIDHVIVAATGDGHRAQWTVRADELPSDLPAPAGSVGAPAPNPEPATPVRPPAPDPEAHLAGLVERAVARQIRPLREELQAYLDRIWMHDVLGGLGYILGLTGVVMWWRGRP
jgi:nickel transport protein